MSDPFYSATKVWTAGSAPTDIAVFTAGDVGADIAKVYVGGSQSGGAAGTAKWLLLKRSTANEGGTIDATAIANSHDGQRIPGSVLGVYTAKPTALGTAGAAFRSAPRDISATGSNWAEMNFDEDYGGKDRIHLAPGEKIYINATGLPNAATSYLTIRWTEPRS